MAALDYALEYQNPIEAFFQTLGQWGQSIGKYGLRAVRVDARPRYNMNYLETILSEPLTARNRVTLASDRPIPSAYSAPVAQPTIEANLMQMVEAAYPKTAEKTRTPYQKELHNQYNAKADLDEFYGHIDRKIASAEQEKLRANNVWNKLFSSHARKDVIQKNTSLIEQYQAAKEKVAYAVNDAYGNERDAFKAGHIATRMYHDIMNSIR